MAILQLTHEDINGGDPVKVLASGLTLSGKKHLQLKPNANINGPVEVQTQSFENLTISIQGVHFTGETDTLDWDDVLTLYQSKYDGTNYIILNVAYGSDDTYVAGLTGTDIKCVLETPSLPINMTSSRDGYLPVGTLILRETA